MQQRRPGRHVLVDPETSLTKICIVSSSEAWELMLETLLERRMVSWCRGSCCGDVLRLRLALALALSASSG